MTISGKEEAQAGQVLVILVLVLAGLLGFAALAIDGGMYFSDRRYDQNAADSSAFAGAAAAAKSMEDQDITIENFDCNSAGIASAVQAAQDAAVSRAASNNFNISQNHDEQHGAVAVCGTEDLGWTIDKFIDVKVLVSSEIETSFAHLFFGGGLKNTVEAVTRVRPRTPYGFGYAIASLDDTCSGNDGGVEFDGDSTVHVISSGVISNSCVEKNGGVSVNTDTGVFYMTTFANNGTSGEVDPTPTQVTDPVPTWTIPAPDCYAPGMADHAKVQNGGSIPPGRYPSIRINNGSMEMAPGLYCVDGAVILNGGVVTVSGSEDEGVTIYMIGGDFSSGGNATVNLRSPRIDSPPALKGVLIYLAVGNDGVVTIQGDSTSFYRGTIFAPDGTIEVGGGSSALGSLSSQFIGNTVKIHGTSQLDVHFNQEDVYTQPAYLNLEK